MSNIGNLKNMVFPIITLIIFFSSYIAWFLNTSLKVDSFISFITSMILIAMCTIAIILIERKSS
ncbi:MAG: hypothetical protein NDF54_09705 [archaeon GB-1867-035]|nr:hypothetical protein [Candidatus Culexmicrobium profundum]